MRDPGCPPHTLADIRSVDLFVAYLYDLPLADWILATVRSLQHSASDAAAAALSAALRRHTDPRAVFETKDAILSALQRFETSEGRKLSRWRASRDLRPITERAALAVLAHRHLSDAEFATLYEPFERLIPSALLFGLSP